MLLLDQAEDDDLPHHPLDTNTILVLIQREDIVNFHTIRLLRLLLLMPLPRTRRMRIHPRRMGIPRRIHIFL